MASHEEIREEHLFEVLDRKKSYNFSVKSFIKPEKKQSHASLKTMSNTQNQLISSHRELLTTRVGREV